MPRYAEADLSGRQAAASGTLSLRSRGRFPRRRDSRLVLGRAAEAGVVRQLARWSMTRALRWLTAGAVVAAAAYGAFAIVTWRGFGSPPPPKPEEHDEDLD